MGTNFTGTNSYQDEFVWGEFSRDEFVWGRIYKGTNFFGDEFSWDEFSGDEFAVKGTHILCMYLYIMYSSTAVLNIHQCLHVAIIFYHLISTVDA